MNRSTMSKRKLAVLLAVVMIVNTLSNLVFANQGVYGYGGEGTRQQVTTPPSIGVEVTTPPNIEVTTPAAIGVTLSIEKRTIGKGDTLSTKEVSAMEGETVWGLVKRVLDASHIEYEIAGTEEEKNVYISSIAGDGEFDYGSGSGWKYEVNGIFPDLGVSEYSLKDGDNIRLRYCVTVAGTEFNQPLVKLLETYIEEAGLYREDLYTRESYQKLKEVLASGERMVADTFYNSTETAIELEVSEVIGKLIGAIEGLEKREEGLLPPSEVPDDFANDIALNKDFLEMKVGDTYQIITRRLQEIIDNPISNTITHPTYHYQVVSGDSVGVDSNGKVTALKSGTSIIAVTYDAVSANGKTYGAISPINTGLFVVNVTEGEDTGITINLSNEGNGVVKETRSYDTFYYTGDSFSYHFSVDATAADTVEVYVNGEKVENQNGIYTVPLRNSGNIIKVYATNSKGIKVYAQVVDARKVEVLVENVSAPDRHDAIRVGDKVRVSFKGITQPIQKLATIYNPSYYDPNYDTGDPNFKYKAGAKVAYTCEQLGGQVYSKSTQYSLATQNTIEFIPTEEGDYAFSGGHIDEGWWGSELGTEKTLSGPTGPNLWGAHHHNKFSELPNIQIKVGKQVIVPAESIAIENVPDVLEISEQTYQLRAKILPMDTTNQKVHWSSSDEEIATVNAEGKISLKKVGEVIVTAQVDGTTISTSKKLTIIPEQPATEEERKPLKDSIEQAKKLNADLYTAKSWEALERALEEAEGIYGDEDALLGNITIAKANLDKCIRALVLDPSKGVQITPQRLQPGDEVTIYFSNLQDPGYSPLPAAKSMYTLYKSDLPGLETIKSDNALTSYNTDIEVLRTIRFKLPRDLKAGVYTLNEGSVQASSRHPQFGYSDSQTFYKEDMPVITLHIEGVDKGYKEVLDETSGYLASQIPGVLNAIGAEWSVLGLARSAYSVDQKYYNDYWTRIVPAIQEAASSSRPFSNKVTEVQRVALAILAMGQDPTDVGGINLVDYTWNKEKYFTSIPEAQRPLGERQGVNELVFGLLLIDAMNYEAPENASISREQIVSKILMYKTQDGGFALAKGGRTADTDITAMTLQALAPYYNKRSDVKEAVDSAITCLSLRQSPTGGFSLDGTLGNESSESTAQVIVALTALGIEPTTDERFIKNGENPLTNLFSYYVGDGMFKHTLDKQGNMMATEQCHYALVAYDRFVNGKTSLYDMTDKVAVQKDLLKALIEVAKEKNEKDYTPESWQVLRITLVKAEEVIAQVDVTQEAINTAYEALQKAIGQLESVEIDKSKLEALLEEATQKKEDAYTQETWQVLATAVEEGKYVLQDKDATKEQVIDAEAKLKKALEGLKPQEIIPPVQQMITLSIDKLTINKGYVMSPVQVPFIPGETVWDVLKRELDQRGIRYDYTMTPQYNSVYVESIDGDGEFDHGEGSGWMYSVNGDYVKYGASLQKLEEGDVVKWRYTTNLGQDLEGNASGGFLPGGNGVQITDEGKVTLPNEPNVSVALPDGEDKKYTVSVTEENFMLNQLLVKIPSKTADVFLDLSRAPQVLPEIKLEREHVGVFIEKGNQITSKEKMFAVFNNEETVEDERLVEGRKYTFVTGNEPITFSKPINIYLKNIGDYKLYWVNEDMVEEISVYGEKQQMLDALAIQQKIGVGKGQEINNRSYGYKEGEDIVITTNSLKDLVLCKVIEKEEKVANVYTDFSAVSTWAQEAVQRALDLGLVVGFDDETLRPQLAMTRGSFVEMLVGARYGTDAEASYAAPFRDVVEDSPYKKAIDVAYEAKLIFGEGENFRPEELLTREEMAVMIARVLGLETKEQVYIADQEAISLWALGHVEAAYSHGLVKGMNGYFNPRHSVSREVGMVMILRMYDWAQQNTTKHMTSAVGNPIGESHMNVAPPRVSPKVKKVLDDTTDYLLKEVATPRYGTIGGEWAVLGLARRGAKVPDQYYANYYKHIEEVVKEEQKKTSRRFKGKVTETQRIAIAVAAIGKDPTNVGGINLVDYSFNKGKYMSDLSKDQQMLGGRQGLNELAFGLITMDLKETKEPTGAQMDRKMLIEEMLEHYQTLDGGFNLKKGSAVGEVDITAMTIQALAPYYGKVGYEKVQPAVDAALQFLSKYTQGDMPFNVLESSESIAQVIVALCSLKIDPTKDQRFIKKERTLIDYLIDYKVEKSGFEHTKDQGVNQMATEQSYYALVAYERLVQGKSPLYHMVEMESK